MKRRLHRQESGSTLICALATILIISLIGANVLLNCATRYNASSKQVKAWKEALYAAEAGGDIGFNEVRRLVSSPSTAFSGWTSPSPAPTPGAGPTPFVVVSYYNASNSFGQSNSLKTAITVDNFYRDVQSDQDCYRIRSTGTARVFGLPRVGMDDRMDGVTRGDSLLRRIDFNYDHFFAAYGYGDGAVPGAPAVAVSTPQISRRVELIAVPISAFTGALKASNSFDGPGSAGRVDSYDSKNGAYTFVANNPASPYYSDSRNGDVSVGTATFAEGGPIYGKVTTGGGTVTNSGGNNISGTIDNSVPFTLPPLVKPTYPTGYVSAGGGSPVIAPSQALPSPGNPNFYVYTGSLGNLTINAAAPNTYTEVTVVVNGDLNKIKIANYVKAKIYFTGNMNVKASDLVNNNVDGTSPYISRAGQLEIYGISPTDGSTQSINIAPPGNVYATIYAPNGDILINGNPEWYGAIVCHNFSGNGNTGFHYDKEIAAIKGIAIDYQLASYIEDVR